VVNNPTYIHARTSIAVDAWSQEIVASDLTGDDVGDITVLPDLLDQGDGLDDNIGLF